MRVFVEVFLHRHSDVVGESFLAADADIVVGPPLSISLISIAGAFFMASTIIRWLRFSMINSSVFECWSIYPRR